MAKRYVHNLVKHRCSENKCLDSSSSYPFIFHGRKKLMSNVAQTTSNLLLLIHLLIVFQSISICTYGTL